MCRGGTQTVQLSREAALGLPSALVAQSGRGTGFKPRSVRVRISRSAPFCLLDAIGRHRRLKNAVFSVRIREQAPICPRGETADTQC